MGTTRRDIQRWLVEGKRQGATHMLVVGDTWDHSDFPVYVKPAEDVEEVFQTYAKGHYAMSRVMEVYSLALSWEMQLAETRAFHL